MQVPAAGMGASGPDRIAANPVSPAINLPPANPAGGDSVAALLAELSQSEPSRLLTYIKGSLAAVDNVRAGDLLGAAAAAMAAGNHSASLDLARQAARLDPAGAESLLSLPALTPIRPALEQLLREMTATARLHAESRLTDAMQKSGATPLGDNPAGALRPDLILLVATRLLEAGGLANYTRSAAVSTALIEQFPWLPAPVDAAPELLSGRRVLRAGWLIPVWIALGVTATGLCWWLRDDSLPLVCGVWAAILAALILNRLRLTGRE